MANRRRGAGIVAAIPVVLGLAASFLDREPADLARRAEEEAAAAPVRFSAGAVEESEAPQGLLNVYFGNLHAHTSYSDGVATPEDAFTHARDAGGLDFMAVTEHNHARAGSIANRHSLYSGSDADSLISTANRLTENGRFVALYGQEYSSISSGNHVNVLDVPAVIDVANGSFDRLVDDWLPAHLDTTGQQAVLLMNHPANPNSPADEEYGRDDFASDEEWRQRMDARAVMIAMINGPSHATGTGLAPSPPAESEYRRYLNLGFHLAPTADQDNHFFTWGTITDARTAVIADELTKPALLAAMRARHVYATEDKNLRLVCRVNGHLCGDRIDSVLPTGTELDVELTIHDDDEPAAHYEVDVFSDQVGGDVEPVPIEIVATDGNTATPLRIEDIRATGPGQYVFFRIHQLGEHEEENDTAWTAPVWFEEGEPAPIDSDVPEADDADLVASRRSEVFHKSLDCLDAQRIKESNRVFGAEARRNRRLHIGCPRT